MEQAAKLRFSLTGFTEQSGFRVFAFTRVGTDQKRAEITVKADLALSRKYAIRVQELPLLCRLFLERRDDGGVMHALTFTEDEMCLYAKESAAARAAGSPKKRRFDTLGGAAVVGS